MKQLRWLMNTVTLSKFYEKPQFYLDEIVKSNKETILIKNGKPYLKILSVIDTNPKNLFKDSIIFEGDIISPIEVDWEANS